ncbi:MAG: aminotransferase class I/II-fold pyridoxal phosphate-dependent enzyme, partial [Gemmatimonadaceae bacterium]|nr:aminotransferase class I/II-fold pyridoxal phosphate-dependent enzyme [Gemmatimonadaceae bacterium]
CGEPHSPPPAHMVAAGAAALNAGRTRYAPPAGIPALREAIAAAMCHRGLDATADDVVVTPGAKPILLYAALTLFATGDEVLVPSPHFPIFDSVARFAGGRPVYYRVDPSRPSGIDLDEIAAKIGPRTRVLMLNTPHNPTGTVLGADALAGLAELVLRHGLTVISDEIYSQHQYDEPHRTIAALPGMAERTVVVDGFSKTFAMTGWRLGYGVMPAPIAERVTRLVINSCSCTATFVQDAGLAALTGPMEPVLAMRRALRERRDVLVRGLNAIPGIRCAMPRGAFFAYPNVAELLAHSSIAARDLAGQLLARHGLACLPGTAFGAGGEGHLRLSYAAPVEQLTTALDRLAACARALGAGQGGTKPLP